MPKNIDVTTDRTQLQAIPAPSNSGILEHKVIADLVITQLVAKGYTILREEYRTNINNDIVQGVLHLTHSTEDPTDGMMITWINSYEKSTGFRCEMGAYSKSTKTNLFIESNTKAFRRNSTDLVKHTIDYLDQRIDEGLNIFGDFLIIRDKLKDTIVSKDTYEKMMGSFYFNDAITSSQLIALKSNHKIEQAANAWGVWLMVANTFKSCHPKVWFKQQSILSRTLIESYIVTPPVGDPAQTDLISMIAEHPIMDESNTQHQESERFDIQDDIETETENLIEAVEEPKVLSLGDYDLAVKEKPVVEAEIPAVEPEVVLEPEPVNETPLFTLDGYDPAEFPLPPEGLPVSINPIEDEYSGTKQDGSEGQQEEVEDTKVIQEPEVVSETAPLSVTSTVEKHLPDVSGLETKEETTDLEAQLLAANPAFENREESSSTSATDETEPNASGSNHKKPGDDGSDVSGTEERDPEEVLERHDVDPRLYSLDPELDYKSSTEAAIPLEDQVALSEVQPVSEAELEVSKEPIVEEPVIKVTVQNTEEQVNSSKEKTLESPNFEF